MDASCPFCPLEEVLSGHKDVAECAVIGVADALKGEIPCGFIVLKAGVNRPVARRIDDKILDKILSWHA